ncbi:MAG: hypothetical protein H6970_03085 [Gammaproteobacteria bacterium]|nr:hypothetical protein [Gammaproteobacteria bacterium]MCP5424042.1 hypothetical protein [Gammaproteobacteria bacterium]MCP5459524.1 hypothetical protein [Gammaproteobacteria bacterium]
MAKFHSRIPLATCTRSLTQARKLLAGPGIDPPTLNRGFWPPAQDAFSF